MAREVVSVYRCCRCLRLVTSETIKKVGKCRRCGSTKIQGTSLTFVEVVLLRIGVIG